MNTMQMTVQAIADIVGGQVEGDGEVVITGVASIDAACAGDVTFAVDARRAASLGRSQAGAAIVPPDAPAAGIPLIRIAGVNTAVATLLGHLACAEDLPSPGVHRSACVADDAELGAGVAIGPGVVIGPRVTIGPRSVLCPNVSVGADVVVGEETILFDGVVIRHGCVVGHRVRIGPNSVIGFEGFGYYHADGAHHRIPHAGGVVIADDVEIGACVCVDRGKLEPTRIGAGTKIDNLVQIAHAVQVGRHCLMAGQVGIAGSVRLGDGVVIGGGAGLRDNITVGDGVQCAAYSAVASNVEAGQVIAGVPAVAARDAYRIIMAQKKLPELLKRVRSLEARLKALESTEDNQ